MLMTNYVQINRRSMHSLIAQLLCTWTMLHVTKWWQRLAYISFHVHSLTTAIHKTTTKHKSVQHTHTHAP